MLRIIRLVTLLNRCGSMPDVTQLLLSIDHGDPHASEELLPLVYEQLRTLAANKLTNEHEESVDFLDDDVPDFFLHFDAPAPIGGFGRAERVVPRDIGTIEDDPGSSQVEACLGIDPHLIVAVRGLGR